MVSCELSKCRGVASGARANEVGAVAWQEDDVGV